MVTSRDKNGMQVGLVVAKCMLAASMPSPRLPYGGTQSTTATSPLPGSTTLACMQDYASMDALREELELEGKSNPISGFISGTINWISEASFGQGVEKQVGWLPMQ